MTTALYFDRALEAHQGGAGHPERPERLLAIETALREANLWDRLEHALLPLAEPDELQSVHTAEHLARLQHLSQSGGGFLDGDTFVGPDSWECARRAAGAAIDAARRIASGGANNAFVATRPPGHHASSGAETGEPWGFCLLNNAALCARAAQRAGLQRVAILDFDVHHGNGTQEIFWRDPSVLFASVHQMPLFPGSGLASERGDGPGKGYTLNLPLPPGSNGAVYHRVWGKVGAAVREFAPDLIVLSAGFDAHAADPLASMELDADDFGALTWDALSWARELCEGRLVALLEGGYDLESLGKSVAASIATLCGALEDEINANP